MKIKLYTACLIAGLAIAGSGCSSKSENPDARNLLAMAENDFNSGNYASSIALLDSLQQTFPAETALQREAMAMRPKVIEAEATKALAAVDSTYNADIETLKSLKTQLKWIKTPGMIEGYWIAPEVYRSDFMNTTGIEARVSEIGEFYIVSSVNPAGNLKHQSIGLKTSAGNARTQNVAYDGESNYRIGGAEVITFSPAQSDTIGVVARNAVEANQAAGASVIFYGVKGEKSVKISPAVLKGIGKAYAYSAATIRARDLQVERERLNRTIEIARRQQQSTASADR